MQKYKQEYDIKRIRLYLYEQNNILERIAFMPNQEKEVNYRQVETEFMKRVKEEIEEYLNGQRRIFDIPIIRQGTEFQQKVWQEISKIPYGETRTYKEIAERIGGRKCYQAIGQACHNNPHVIIVPCHRVVGSHSELGGYAGGLELKQKLLNLEQGIYGF